MVHDGLAVREGTHSRFELFGLGILVCLVHVPEGLNIGE